MSADPFSLDGRKTTGKVLSNGHGFLAVSGLIEEDDRQFQRSQIIRFIALPDGYTHPVLLRFFRGDIDAGLVFQEVAHDG
jgi:hypothetical protein